MQIVCGLRMYKSSTSVHNVARYTGTVTRNAYESGVHTQYITVLGL